MSKDSLFETVFDIIVFPPVYIVLATFGLFSDCITGIFDLATGKPKEAKFPPLGRHYSRFKD